MAKQSVVTEAQAEKKDRRPTPPAQMGQLTEPAGLLGVAGHGSLESQAARLGDRRLPVAQRHALARQIGAVQGNLHLQRALQEPIRKVAEAVPMPPVLAVVSDRLDDVPGVQRQSAPEAAPALPEQAPQRPLIKLPYTYSVQIPMNFGKYVKITGAAFQVQGTIEELPGPGREENGLPPVVLEQARGKSSIAMVHEVKTAADGWFAGKLSSLSSSFKPYTQENYSFQRKKNGGLEGKASYECGLDIDPLHWDGSSANLSAEFSILEFKKEMGEKPEFEFFTVTGKAAVGGEAEDWPVPGFKASLKGELSVNMEPDYITLGMMALQCPVTWVAAAAAGAAAITYFTLQDIERQGQLFARTRVQANFIAKSANAYGAAIIGETPHPRNRFDEAAIAQGNADLEVT